MKNKENNKKATFQMLGETTNVFKIFEKDNEFVIEIRREKKFKNIWLVKLNELYTNKIEVEYYSQDQS